MSHKVFSQSIAAPFREVRTASTAGGGTALTTTAGLISIPLGADWIKVAARNFAGANAVQFLLNPFLTILRTTDSLAGPIYNITPGGNSVDISKEMQDGDTTDFPIDALPTAANGGYIYVGADSPFRGVAVDLGSEVNDDASVLTVNYWNGSAWTDTSDTDGTDVGGDTMKQDGNVTWSVPAAWTKASLSEIGDVTRSTRNPQAGASLYWTRWQFSAAMDASVDIAQIRPLNRSTTYAELAEGDSLEFSVDTYSGGVATVEALTDAGTANVIVTAATLRGEDFE